MIHGKPLSVEELRKEVEVQKQLIKLSKELGNPIIVAVEENPTGDGDHISSLLLTGLTVLSDEDNKNGQ